MDPPSTVTTPEHRTKGGLDAHEYGYTLSSIHRLRSLLLRESNNRGEFWSHAFQNPELPLICCGDQDFRVHIKSCHENPRSLRTEIVSHDANFHQMLSDECGSSPASFIFIDSREHGSGRLSLTWPMLREFVTNLQLMPQFADFLLWKINNQRSRGSTIASFASSTDTGVGEICLSLYHCWIQQPRSGQKFKVSVERATIYTQAQQGRLRWIVIGSPAVWDLQTVYLHIVHPKGPSLSPFIIFIATNGWQITLDLMEDDLTTELKNVMDRSYDPNHSKLINALCRLQGQLLNAKWQIEANDSTPRIFEIDII